MVDNFSTIFESENSLSLLPFFLPLTIPIFIEEFPFPTEKRKRWKSWRLQKFYRLVPSRDRFRIACNIEEGKGRRRRGLRSPVRPFNIKCILFMQRCTFDNIPNGTLLWLHSITQRIPSNPSARNRTAKKLHRCSSVFPILHEETFLLHYLPYIHTYFHRLHSTRSTFPFSFPLLLRFFTEEIRPAPNHRRATKIPRTHTHMQRTRISRGTIKQESLQEQGEPIFDRITRRHFWNPCNSCHFFDVWNVNSPNPDGNRPLLLRVAVFGRPIIFTRSTYRFSRDNRGNNFNDRSIHDGAWTYYDTMFRIAGHRNRAYRIKASVNIWK